LTVPVLVKFPPVVIAVLVCEYTAPPLFVSAVPALMTPLLETLWLLINDPAVTEQVLVSDPPPLIVNVPPTDRAPALVTEPLDDRAPVMVIVAPEALLIVTWFPSDTPVSSCIVPVARLNTCTRPLAFGCAEKRTVPSLSSIAPVPAASAGRTTLPRTKTRVAPLRFWGVNAAPDATHTVPRLLFMLPVNVPPESSTTSVLERLRFDGMFPAS
jgi:hypothetical protein